MARQIEAHQNALVDNTDISFYGDFDVRFHIESDREFEPEEVTEMKEDGTEVTKTEISTTPCPHVDVYLQEDCHVIIHLPNNIVMDYIVSTGENTEEFLRGIVNSIDTGYNGIQSIMSYEQTDDELSRLVEQILSEEVPVEVPA